MPPGPILLRDWGLTEDGFAPGGGHGHKRKKMKAVLDALPDLPFVLVGDSGQEDAEHYLSLAEEYGSRIRVVYIRTVPQKSGRAEVLAEIADAVRAAGTELVVVNDSAAIRDDAIRRGLVPGGTAR
jgi:phosphatidate phosphatase APP1